MNDHKTPSIWKWSVALLTLCNIGLILTLLLKPHMGPHPHHEQPKDYVIRNLKLNDEQVKKYEALIADHQREMKQFREELGEDTKVLFANLRNGGGPLNTDSVAQLIANGQKRVELVTYQHFAQVRLLCNDEQKAAFDKIITDVIKRMNNTMHGDGPPHEHDGQGPLPGERDEHGPPDDRPGPPQNP